MTRKVFSILLLSWFLVHASIGSGTQAPPKKVHKVLIIDGQNNHRNMNEGTQMMKGYLEETGLFAVEVATTPKKGENMESFKPDFSKFDVVLSNYNGDAWPQETNQAFEKFIKNGEGLSLFTQPIIHSRNGKLITK